MKSLIMDIGLYQSKIGYLEDKELIDLFVEDKKEEKTEGNIYRGIVENMLLGMEAAFVNIGLHKNGYLPLKSGEKLKKGQEVLVQVKKEAIGEKGVKLTREISIPGRYLVLLPKEEDIAVSNKIDTEKEKKRLREIGDKIRPKDMGLIIRTEGEGKEDEDFEGDLRNLLQTWEEIKKEEILGMGPKLLYKELDLSLKIIRDIFTKDFDEIIINDLEKYEQLKKMIKNMSPACVSKIKCCENGFDLFDFYGIKNQMKKALNKKVWLKSGGYIIIDKTEALTVIDVNTGKYTGNLGLEKTVFNTNCEAAKEIAKQVRLRDIGGIIIVDFIDMRKNKYKEKLMEKLQYYLKKDKNKAKVLGMTNLGLVEIVRRKSRDAIDRYFKRDCIVCKGEGKIKSKNSILDEIEKEVARLKMHTSCEGIVFKVSSPIYNTLRKNEFKEIEYISSQYDFNIHIEESTKLKIDQLETIFE